MIIKQNSITPNSLKKKAVITVIYKNGDVANPENFWPICGLQQLYKLFSAMLCDRQSSVLDRHWSADQAEFRKTVRTTDHLMTYKLTSQKSREWGTDMWVAAIGSKKAFDSIRYICLLKKCTRKR